MARTAENVWLVSYTFRDNNNKTATCGVSYAGAMTFAEVELAAEALAVDLDAISSAALDRYGIVRRYVEGTPATPPADSEVERKLIVSLGTATHRGVSSIEVPSPVFTIEINGTDVVDPANALVTALISELTAGLLLPGNGPVTWFGADLTRAEPPYIDHRNRDKV